MNGIGGNHHTGLRVSICSNSWGKIVMVIIEKIET